MEVYAEKTRIAVQSSALVTIDGAKRIGGARLGNGHLQCTSSSSAGEHCHAQGARETLVGNGAA